LNLLKGLAILSAEK